MIKKIIAIIAFTIILLSACKCKVNFPSIKSAETTVKEAVEAVTEVEVGETETEADSENAEPKKNSWDNRITVEYRWVSDNPRNYSFSDESLVYTGEVTHYISSDGRYTFDRFTDYVCISRADLDDPDRVYLSGDTFIITEDNVLCYVNKNRKWVKFDYMSHDFTKKSPVDDDFITSVGDYADRIDGFDQVQEYFFESAEPVDGKIAIATLRGTLLFYESGLVSLSRFEKEVRDTYLPFRIREISYHSTDFESFIKYTAILENNSIVNITVYNDGNITTHVVRNGKKDVACRLLTCNEENHISTICTQGEFVFFYVEDELHLSDGQWDILIDDVPWSIVWIGDYFGPGKEVSGAGWFHACSDVADYDTFFEPEDEVFMLEEEMKKTGINY